MCFWLHTGAPTQPVFSVCFVQYQSLLTAWKQTHVVDSLSTVFFLSQEQCFVLTRRISILSLGLQLLPRTVNKQQTNTHTPVL